MMLRLLELYSTVQGEGPRTGTPTIFVRFAGCNLKCPAWPCDTPFSIDPKIFENEQELITPESLAGRVQVVAHSTGIHNVCLTGGEPFVQRHSDLQHLVEQLRQWHSIEIFSNGTIAYPDWATEQKQVSFVLDWKLPGSGETSLVATRIKNVERLWASRHTIKFTIKDDQDFVEAYTVWRNFLGGRVDEFPGEIYAGPVWDEGLTAADIVSRILTHRLPWRLNLQTHKYIFTADPNARGV